MWDEKIRGKTFLKSTPCSVHPAPCCRRDINVLGVVDFLQMFGAMLIVSVMGMAGEENVILNKCSKNIYCTSATYEQSHVLESQCEQDTISALMELLFYSSGRS